MHRNDTPSVLPKHRRTSGPWGRSVSRRCVACTVILAFALTACDTRPIPRAMYKGQFRSINSSDRAIWMGDCSEFGFASPQAGVLIPGSSAWLGFPALSRLPESTEITWWFGEDRTPSAETHRTTVKVREHVPKGTEGTIIFEFTHDYEWKVRFERKSP